MYNNNAFLCAFIDIPQERNETMVPWQEILTAVFLFFLILAVRSALSQRRDFQFRDAARKLELVLQPRESIKVICPQKKCNCVLTSKRVLFETKAGFTAVRIKDIRKTAGFTGEGKRTTSVPRMASLTLKAREEHRIFNTGKAFEDLAGQLVAKVKKQNEKQKCSNT